MFFLKLFPYLRRKVELCCLLLTRQVYTLKGLLCRSAIEVLTKMAARLLEVRLRLPVEFFFLFTWNIEFLQHLLSNLFIINKLRFLGQISFLLRNETTSSTRINGSCKQSIGHKSHDQLQQKEKRRFESIDVFSCIKKSQP